MGLGEAVWADFLSNIHSKTSPIDLDRFRGDPGDPKIPKQTNPEIFGRIPENQASPEIPKANRNFRRTLENCKCRRVREWVEQEEDLWDQMGQAFTILSLLVTQ